MSAQSQWVLDPPEVASPVLDPGFAAGRARSWGSWYIAFVAGVMMLIACFRLLHPNGWTPGDWLVNYAGGFVRRGLPGQSILLAAHGLHVSPVPLGTLVPLVCALLFFVLVLALFRRSSASLWTFAALVSPATLAFPILDPLAALRKDLLILTALAFLLCWLSRPPVRRGRMAAFLALAGSIVVLSHEGLLPYLVYLFGALVLAFPDLRRAVRIAAIPCLAVAVSAAAVLHDRGSAAVQQAICRSLGPTSPAICAGSIAYLAKGTGTARAEVLRDVHAYHYFFFYSVLTLLALLPLVGMAARLGRHRDLRARVRTVIITGLIAVAASLPLFFFAMDWGRWIHIHIMCLFLLLLFVDVQHERAAAEWGPSRPAPARTKLPTWAVVGLLLYATCWNLPHFGNYPKKGYLNFPLHLLKQHLEHRSNRSAVEDLMQ